ncbi:MAG: hypothetical protein AB8H80_16855 [Planctomycetota bacterium]
MSAFQTLTPALALAAALALATPAAAQQTGTSLEDAMLQLSEATAKLQGGGLDAASRSAALDAIQAVLPSVANHAQQMPFADAAQKDIASLHDAVDKLRKPLPGRASDAMDLLQLRRACTSCHVQNRSSNASRGMFPARHTTVAGVLDLRNRAGSVPESSAGVVVFLERPGERPTPLPRRPSISQRDRRFEPAVLVVPTGTTVRFPNDDVVFHNVFSLSRGNAFDLGTYAKGRERNYTFAAPGLAKVHCNIHADMVAHVLVLNSTHTAVTDERGFWSIPDVRAGTYTLRVWHALAKELRQPLTVAKEHEDDVLRIDLQLQETKRRISHTDKHGRAYRRKY